MSDAPHTPRHSLQRPSHTSAANPRHRRTRPEPSGFAKPDAIKAPGFAAFFRRHPDSVRQAGTAAIAGGLVIFAIATAVNAGADPSSHRRANTAAPVTDGAQSTLPALDIAGQPSVAPVVAKNSAPAPAPVNKAVISGLAANGIPNVALNAYRVAAARMASADPGCGIDWALLAGIGREESDHGRFAGAVLHADGVSTPRIIGIPLDGHGTALILDTDHGRLDGDTVYDRAVGPMQFIPSTWAIYGTDANGDGKADPFNINDAALTAARYLCAAGGNLRTHAGQVSAVLSYNHSSQYLAQVLALADAYRRGVPITGLPVGMTTGALPPVKHTGTPPPANPGAPTANRPAAPASTSHPVSGGSAPGSPSKPGTPGAPGGGTTSATTVATASPGPGGGGSSPSSPAGGSTGSSSSAPPPVSSPTPTPTKCILVDLLNPGKCAIPGK